MDEITVMELVRSGEIPVMVVMAWLLYRIDKALERHMSKIDTLLEYAIRNGAGKE